MNDSININWRHFDFWLLGAVALLILFGVTMIRSAISGNIELAGYDTRQLIFAGIGMVAIIIVTAIDYHFWASISSTLYVVTVIALAALLGVSAVFGSSRWFSLVVVNVQPSELAKIVLILVLAQFFTQNQHRMDDVRTVIRSFISAMGITIWIVLQPNLSTSIVMMVIWFALLWAAGLRVKHLMIFAGIGLIAAVILIPIFMTVEFPGIGKVIKDYQVSRVTSFLFPDPDARHGDDYNIEQALISIGTGGWFGQGYGHGSQVQLRFLKVRWSDFIFSAMAQEFGFVGTVLVMLVLLFVVLRCLRAARLSRDTYGAFICYGVATLLMFQAVVNIGVNLRLMPATGLTLPFISYGGSSLLSNMLGIGLVESVILRHKSLEF
jgi:rod shape determining protein RodA